MNKWWPGDFGHVSIGGQVFNFFKRKKHGSIQNALIHSDEGIAIARLSLNQGQTPTVHSLDFKPVNSATESAPVLKKLTSQYALEGEKILTSLMPTEASLVMLEKPEVEESELRQAVRWQIKDSLSFDLNEAIVDVFEIPGQKERGRAPLVYVTSAEKNRLKDKIKLFDDNKLELTSIDIAELAMRNIAALLPEDKQGVAMLKLDRSNGLITLTHEESLFLARNIDVGYLSLGTEPSAMGETEDSGLAFAEEISPEKQRTLDVIVLEVQRSLDYYESHFAKPAINSLVIAPLPYEIPGVISYLASALGIQVRLLDLNVLIDVAEPVSHEKQAHCFYAIGTALREESGNVSQDDNKDVAA